MNSTTKLRCILLPTTDYKLILPHSTVEEILPFAVIEEKKDSSNYILGVLNWRRYKLPLISMEVLNHQVRPEIKRRTRAAVVQFVSADGVVKYFSIILSGMPKMIVLSPSDLVDLDEDNRPACTIKKVSFNEETAYIPDMSAIEYVLNKALK
ncbi:MAG: chemotaxis protein CheW [Gammaproteobacteria bacterium]|nr:chemotaxis protein CheW [Gammaproteobacteria bacterium]